MSIVHLHLLLNHVPVVGTLFTLVLSAAVLLLLENVALESVSSSAAVCRLNVQHC
jgi:amino acid transporter